MSKLRELAKAAHCPRFEDTAYCDDSDACIFDQCPRAALLAEVERRDKEQHLLQRKLIFAEENQDWLRRKLIAAQQREDKTG